MFLMRASALSSASKLLVNTQVNMNFKYSSVWNFSVQIVQEIQVYDDHKWLQELALISAYYIITWQVACVECVTFTTILKLLKKIIV